MMAVSYDTIISKMLHELRLAKESKASTHQMKRHIANVRVLSDLILEEDDVEYGFRKTLKKNVQPMHRESVSKVTSDLQGVKVDDDGANGDSIFDF